MSAWISVEDPACCGDHSLNITSNLNAMFRAVGLDWADWERRDDAGFHDPSWQPKAIDMLPTVVLAHHRLIHNREDYLHLQPENGWGDLPGAINFLEAFAANLATHPTGTVRISR